MGLTGQGILTGHERVRTTRRWYEPSLPPIFLFCFRLAFTEDRVPRRDHRFTARQQHLDAPSGAHVQAVRERVQLRRGRGVLYQGSKVCLPY